MKTIKFWEQWYLKDYKQFFISTRGLSLKDKSIQDNKFHIELENQLKEQIQSYNNRKDKETKDYFRQQQIIEQKNQIEALKNILKRG